eukprot:Partr_v1_DN27512_c6_g1_i1_m30263
MGHFIDVDPESGDLISTGHYHKPDGNGGTLDCFFVRRIDARTGNRVYTQIYQVLDGVSDDVTTNLLIDNVRGRIYVGGQSSDSLMVAQVSLSTGQLISKVRIPNFFEMGDMVFDRAKDTIFISALTLNTELWTGQIDLTNSNNFRIGNQREHVSPTPFGGDNRYRARGRSVVNLPYQYHTYYDLDTCDSSFYAIDSNGTARDVGIPQDDCLTSMTFHELTNSVVTVHVSLDTVVPTITKIRVSSQQWSPFVWRSWTLSTPAKVTDIKFLSGSNTMYYATENGFGKIDIPFPVESRLNSASSSVLAASYSESSSVDPYWNGLFLTHLSTLNKQTGANAANQQFILSLLSPTLLVIVAIAITVVVIIVIFGLGFKCGRRFGTRGREQHKRKSIAPVSIIESTYMASMDTGTMMGTVGNTTTLNATMFNTTMALNLPAYKLIDIASAIKIEEQIGAGGFGQVYKGTILDRELIQKYQFKAVAVKYCIITETDPLMSMEQRKSFDQEVAIMQHFESNPNISVLVGFSRNPAAMVMKLYDGGNLERYITNSQTKFDPQEHIAADLSILSDVSSAVQALHEADISHSDLKPANVLIEWPNGTL